MEVKGGKRPVVVSLRHDVDYGERLAHLRKLIVKSKSASECRWTTSEATERDRANTQMLISCHRGWYVDAALIGEGKYDLQAVWPLMGCLAA